MTSRRLLPVGVLVAISLLTTPALAKTKLQGEALRQACITAFGDRDHFDWVPRMGLANAVATCNSALRQFPNDPEVRLYDAVARDQLAERGGSQEDNLHATEVYRQLAGQKHPIAEYALGTMFDESSGVSTADALAYLGRARDGEFGASIRCEALRTFGYADLDGNGPAYDVAAAESMSYGNYVCAGYLANMFWNGYVSASDLPMQVGEYARYAAVHGDPAAMAMLGIFYAYGTGSTEVELQLQDQYTARQDAERAGYWLLLAYWSTSSSWSAARYAEFWDDNHLHSPVVVEAMQTALKELGYYSGAIDGNFLPATEDAIAAFEASDIDAVFQAVRAKEKYAPDLGRRQTIHIGSAAIGT